MDHFKQFCSKNNFVATYITQTQRGKYQVTLKITRKGKIMYHLRSKVTDSEINALNSIVLHILFLAH
jgi:hypothetical protein